MNAIKAKKTKAKPKRPTRKYTAKQKKDCCDYARIHGLDAASKHFDYPKRTVCRWLQNAGIDPWGAKNDIHGPVKAANETRQKLREAKLEDIKDMLLVRIKDLDARLDNSTDQDSKSVMTSIGIAIDKYQLLTGGPTSREAVSTDDAKAKIISRLAQREKPAGDRAADGGPDAG